MCFPFKAALLAFEEATCAFVPVCDPLLAIGLLLTARLVETAVLVAALPCGVFRTFLTGITVLLPEAPPIPISSFPPFPRSVVDAIETRPFTCIDEAVGTAPVKECLLVARRGVTAPPLACKEGLGGRSATDTFGPLDFWVEALMPWPIKEPFAI